MNHKQGSMADLPPHWLHPFAWLLSHDPEDVYPVAQAFHILDNGDEKPVYSFPPQSSPPHLQCYHGFNEKVYIFNKKAMVHIWDSTINCVPVHSASSFFQKVHQQSMLMLYFEGWGARRLPNVSKILMMGESKWFLQRKNDFFLGATLTNQ